MFEIIKVQFLLEPLLLFSLLKQLWKKKTEIEEIFSFVGEVDVLMSIAALRKEPEGYCIPEITETRHSLIAKNVYHPLIEHCVANSIEINKNSVLITGSNMSGKTTFIRTIAINAITAMTLNTCFAEAFSLPRMRILSAIRISDDLVNDKSYYFEEVLTIKDMIDESRNNVPNLFFLDEIFKGTNTVERISAGKAVLSWLAKSDNIVFVSTHDMELTDLLSEEYELYHFSEQVGQKNVAFDYKLKAGKNHNRNAIRILEINGYPESVIQEAIDISKKFDDARSTEMK
jgi:DNA mismatch repair ATPase MutS